MKANRTDKDVQVPSEVAEGELNAVASRLNPLCVLSYQFLSYGTHSFLLYVSPCRALRKIVWIKLCIAMTQVIAQKPRVLLSLISEQELSGRT